MTKFDSILNLLIPGYLPHTGFELAARRQRWHIIGIIFVALCTLVVNANMDQAVIGTIDQAQVSNYCPVPPDTVIAQSLMLFDHSVNCTSLEIYADNFFLRLTNVIHDKCSNGMVAFVFGENDFSSSKHVHHSDPPDKFIAGCFPQFFNAVVSACSAQDISTVFADLLFDRINCKPPIRIADADITPFPLSACNSNMRAKIELVRQDSDIKFVRYICTEGNYAGHFSEFFKRNLKLFDLFFLDIHQRVQRYGDSSVERTGFDNCMAHAVSSGYMIMDLTDGLHFLSSLYSLIVINNQQVVLASFFVDTFENSAGVISQRSHLAKLAFQEKITVIKFCEAFFSRA